MDTVEAMGQLVTVFPQVCPQFLQSRLDRVAVDEGRNIAETEFHQLLDTLLAQEEGLPHREQPTVQSLELEHYHRLVSFFPEVCPEFLEGRVRALTPRPPEEEQLEQEMAEPIAQSVMAEMTAKFSRLVENLLDQRRSTLPTRKQWEQRRREQEEVTRWPSR